MADKRANLIRTRDAVSRAALAFGVAALGGIGALVALLYSRRAAADSPLEEITVDVKRVLSGNNWQPPAKYAAAITTAENYYGLPPGLLARQLFEESGYRPEVIDGTVRSSAGAIGIAQIVPAWHPGVNPLDPFASINYAAKYDRQLFEQFGSWELALAAYNFGPSNVQRTARSDWPSETTNYVADITRDVPV